MHRSSRRSGRRSLNYDNLAISTVTIVVAFLSFLYLLTPGGLREFGHPPVGHAERNVWPRNALYVQVVADGTTRLALPGDTLNSSFIVQNGVGLVDGVRKIQQFFQLGILQVPTAVQQSGKTTGLATPSRLYRSALLTKRFDRNINASTGSVNVVHLCSAASCVGPFLTLAFARHTQAAALVPMSIQALVYGEPSLVCLVSEELRANGVRVPGLTALGGAHGSLDFPEITDTNTHPPLQSQCASATKDVILYGSDAAWGGKTSAFCPARRCAYTTDAHSVALREAEGSAMVHAGAADSAGSPLARRIRRDQANVANAAVAAAIARVVALSGLQLEGRALPSAKPSLSRLHAQPVDLVFIDVDADEAAAVATYLGGLAESLNDNLVAPDNIIVPVHDTPWAADVLRGLEELTKTSGYTVLVLRCVARRMGGCGVGDEAGGVLSSTDIEHMRGELSGGNSLMEGVLVGATGLAGQRLRSSEPPVLLLATRVFHSADEVRAAASVSSGVAGIAGEAGRFFAASSSGDVNLTSASQTAQELDLDFAPWETVDPVAVHSVGRSLFRVSSAVMKTFLYGLPVAICAFILFNLSKAWRHR